LTICDIVAGASHCWWRFRNMAPRVQHAL